MFYNQIITSWSEENIGINRSNIFWMSPKAKETRAKMNKWDQIKLKNFCTAKESINSEKTTY